MAPERIENLKNRIGEAKRRGDQFIGPLVFSVDDLEEIVTMIEGEHVMREALHDLATMISETVPKDL